MARSIRIEYPGALYHITSRGNARNKTFFSKNDYVLFLNILKEVIERFNWICYAYCLMPNHYHLFIETPDPNLSQGMRQLNGVFTQRSNQMNKRVGHLFQGRFKAAVVEKESYFGEVMRYIALNPVKAKLVSRPGQWIWNSYGEIIGLRKRGIVDVKRSLSKFHRNENQAKKIYKSFVNERNSNEFLIKKELKNEIILGTREFIEQIKDNFLSKEDTAEIPKIQRYASRPELEKIFKGYPNIDKAERNKLVHKASIKYGYSLTEISDYLGCHYSTLSKIISGLNKEQEQ